MAAATHLQIAPAWTAGLQAPQLSLTPLLPAPGLAAPAAAAVAAPAVLGARAAPEQARSFAAPAEAKSLRPELVDFDGAGKPAAPLTLYLAEEHYPADEDSYGEKWHGLVRQAVGRIRSFSEAETFFKTMASGAKTRNDRVLLDHLGSVDLAGALAGIRGQLSQAQVDRLLRLAQGASQDPRWQPQFLPFFKMALRPSEAVEFVRTLPEDEFLERQDGYDAGINMATAVRRLPERWKQAAMAEVRRRIAEISKPMEEQTAVGFLGAMRGPRVVRRNLEMLYSLLIRDRTSRLKASMARAETAQAPELLDAYLKDNFSGLGPSRGGYGASPVLAAVSLLHERLADFLDDDERFIQLYGSFPNGKAAFQTSDLDLHLSDSLAKDYLDLFEKADSNARDWSKPLNRHTFRIRRSRQPLERHLQLQAALMGLAHAVAQTLGSPAAPKDQLQLTYSASLGWDREPDSAREFNQLALYNPVIFKISRSRVVLQIYDRFGSPRLREIELPARLLIQ